MGTCAKWDTWEVAVVETSSVQQKPLANPYEMLDWVGNGLYMFMRAARVCLARCSPSILGQ